MADKIIVSIRALKRFNNHAVGDVFDAEEADAEVWIREKLCERTEPPEDETETASPDLILENMPGTGGH